jgi:hypothetical protein
MFEQKMNIDKLKLAAGIIFYNDAKGLDRLLAGIANKVDLAICVDGRFQSGPSGPPLSNDGSRDIVLSYGNTLLVDCPNASEYDKRSKYIEICEREKVDYLLILDTDEYVDPDYNDWDLFRKDLVYNAETKWFSKYNVFAVLIEVNSPDYEKTDRAKPYTVWQVDNKREYGYYPRVWYRPEQMEYNKGTHYLFHNKDPKNKLHNQETNAAIEIIQGVRFLHDHKHRDQNHQESRKQYQDWLIDHEQKLTSTWCLYYSWPGINPTAPSVKL